jgi:hypothetical protein
MEEFQFNSGDQGDHWVPHKIFNTPHNLKLKKMKAIIDWKDQGHGNKKGGCKIAIMRHN